MSAPLRYGVGAVTATSIRRELGDVSRLSAPRKPLRCAGLDVGAQRSRQQARPGRLTRQGVAATALGALRGGAVGLQARQRQGCGNDATSALDAGRKRGPSTCTHVEVLAVRRASRSARSALRVGVGAKVEPLPSP
jgi:hypothetical protein